MRESAGRHRRVRHTCCRFGLNRPIRSRGTVAKADETTTPTATVMVALSAALATSHPGLRGAHRVAGGASTGSEDVALRYYRVIYDDLLHRPVAITEVGVHPSVLTDAIESAVDQGTTAVVTVHALNQTESRVIAARVPSDEFPAVLPEEPCLLE